MGNIIIKEAVTQRDRRRFVNFPNQLYKNNKNYVPGFFDDDIDDWNPSKNPAFDRG